MTSNRPYLVRALYEWICDNGLTPYLLVEADAPGVRVPRQAIKDGRIVLNIAPRAVHKLELADDVVSFQARFSGVPMLVLAPMPAVLAIYAMENGQGMLFPAEPDADANTEADAAPEAGLSIVSDAEANNSELSGDVSDDEPPDPGASAPPGRSGGKPGHLRVIK